MSEARTRPEVNPARAARHATVGDDVFTVLARRVKLPTVPGSSAPQVLRAASVPLVAATLLATANSGASAAAPRMPTSGATMNGAPGLTAARAAPTQATYTVREGDTVSAISARTGVAVRTIITANRLPANGLIRPGQVLTLPGLKAPAKASGKPAPKAAPVVVHVVRAGDTVSAIAARYKITVKAVLAANRLGAQGLIRPGQKIRLPGVAPAAAKPKTAATPTRPYTVKAGDTLIGISAKEKVTLATVLTLNRITRTTVIHPGRKLLLPGAPKSAVPNTFLGRRYPDAVAQAAAVNRAALAKRAVPGRAEVKTSVTATARSMGVDPALALAVAWQESGFNARVVSPANAIGSMQVIPGTGRWASDLVGRELDLLDPEDNVTAGVAVLAALLAQATEDEAIAGYYQGLASVRSRGMFTDTKSYLATVKAHQARFAKELAGTKQ